MKRLWIAITLLILTTMLLGACASSKSSQEQYAEGIDTDAMVEVERPAMEKAVAPAQPSMAISNDEAIAAQTAPSEQLLSERKIIYDANISLVVTDTVKAAQDITAMANSMGGYVAGMNGYRRDDVEIYDITIRIPAGQFESARSVLRNMAIRVENENLSTNDVTDQYYDIDARLETLKATEKELTQLLKETRERGGKVEDIMDIYDRLIQIRSEIESLQGQLNRLDKLVAFSTINIHLEPSVLSQPIQSKGWNPAETIKRSLQSLISILTGLANFLIALIIVVLPVALIILLPLAVIVWLIRRWTQRRKKV